MSFFCPVPAFQEDVSYGLRSVAALAFISVGLIDAARRPILLVRICVIAELIVENRSSGSSPKSEEVSTVLLPFDLM
ncbi:hypothetical protein EMCG_03231 [[Emmonsia] crescens]|uniref:Uncharacterized protein n=1 Tax=[Emmonsia] crescens TaxID=73230 RepID=A0A0G2J0I5_9EURO|nr:hypothetical protein EMCG_03231 [Emmonsia crescens UAMH 3008]